MGNLTAASQSSIGTLHCELAVGHVQFVGFSIQETRRLRDHRSKSDLRRCALATLSSIGTSSWERGINQRVSPTPDLDIECVATPIWRPRSARTPNTRSASHLSDSGTLLVFAARVFLVAVRCSVMTTASDESSAFRQSLQGGTLGPMFRSSLAWRACTRSSTQAR